MVSDLDTWNRARSETQIWNLNIQDQTKTNAFTVFQAFSVGYCDSIFLRVVNSRNGIGDVIPIQPRINHLYYLIVEAHNPHRSIVTGKQQILTRLVKVRSILADQSRRTFC
jgi:hypothetical protein